MLQFDPDVFRLLAMFMPRSTCLCVLCHVFAQIYIPMLRSMCLCASCHAYMHRSMLVSMQCASKALLSLDISLSCVLALIGGVQIQILWARSTFTHLGLYQRVWIISSPYLCLLACFYALSPCQPFQIQDLPRLMPSVDLCLCGYFHPSQGLFGCNHL